MVERIYLGPKASVEAMLRGALDEVVRWLARAPRLDLHAVDLTDPVLHPAALLFHTSLALEGVGPLLEVVEQILKTEITLLARAMEPQVRGIGAHEAHDHAMVTALTRARYRWAWHVHGAVGTWRAAYDLAVKEEGSRGVRDRVRTKLIALVGDLDNAQVQLGALMAPMREAAARLKASAAEEEPCST
jgi:hypothetical protein